MTARNLGRRLAALEGRRGGRPAYVVECPPDLSDADVVALVARHRARTGYAGPVILAPPEAATTQAWAEARVSIRAR